MKLSDLVFGVLRRAFKLAFDVRKRKEKRELDFGFYRVGADDFTHARNAQKNAVSARDGVACSCSCRRMATGELVERKYLVISSLVGSVHGVWTYGDIARYLRYVGRDARGRVNADEETLMRERALNIKHGGLLDECIQSDGFEFII